AGFIALNSGIGAGAEEILIPEENIGLPKLLEKLKRSKASGKSSCIVIVAEGEKSGKNVFELSDYVEENLPDYDVRVSVIGHIQRGGSPSCFDRVLASRSGVAAVEALLKGEKNIMIGLQNDLIAYTPLEKAIKGENKIDEELVRTSAKLSIEIMEKVKIGINGFGRVGRFVLRESFERNDMEVVAINELMEIDLLAY